MHSDSHTYIDNGLQVKRITGVLVFIGVIMSFLVCVFIGVCIYSSVCVLSLHTSVVNELQTQSSSG